MTTYVYDGSFYGFMTLLNFLLENKINNPCIENRNIYKNLMFNPTQEIKTNKRDAKEFIKKINKTFSFNIYTILKNAFLSEDSNIEYSIFNFLKLGFKNGNKVMNMVNNKFVLHITSCAHKTSWEAQKYLGFVRFSQITQNLLISNIEPTTNVLPIIGKHFKNRLSNENWIIRDTKRNSALIYLKQTKNLELVNLKDKGIIIPKFSTEDVNIKELWKTYFDTMGIEERKNSKLQRSFVPLKHRKHLPEFE